MSLQSPFLQVLSFVAFSLLMISGSEAADQLPTVPDGFVVDVVAKEPMVSNPCVMAFDQRGRLCVAQGPQWRGPTPETPGDRIDILIDEDDDGKADAVKTFAKGFNSVQGIAWHGKDLWVANSPDLTVVRDTDGDDKADVYVRVYTGLGNLEHSLHGLNFGPDGLLYMSKGNSKGYNRLDQLAPKAFRELWGLQSPEKAPDYTPLEFHTAESYQRKYHTPQDDWGQQGGILRCVPYMDSRNNLQNDSRNDSARDQKPAKANASKKLYARELEIVSRGFRNPWDITFDDQFNWLGTDNDQTQGDKIFAPFHGGHFGWGHPWSFHWTGENHIPSVPACAPLFEGSGTGVIHYHANQFPEKYRDLFFVNDWMRREIYAFRPKWNGALMKSLDDFPPVFAHVEGGRSLPSSSGTVFEPTDIEVGPDGALYVLSWGHGYGGTLKEKKQIDAGRVYRIRYAKNPLTDWKSKIRSTELHKLTLEQLFSDLGSDIPAWQVNAQNEFLNRSETAKAFLKEKIASTTITTAQQTWALWTLGRISNSSDIDVYFRNLLNSSTNNIRIQSIRILAHRIRRTKENERNKTVVAKDLQKLLADSNARIRHEAVQAIWQISDRTAITKLLTLAANEQDRIVFYSTWNTLRELGTLKERKKWIADSRPAVRLAAVLGLFHDDQISAKEATPLLKDPDKRVADLTNDWLQRLAKRIRSFNSVRPQASIPIR